MRTLQPITDTAQQSEFPFLLPELTKPRKSKPAIAAESGPQPVAKTRPKDSRQPIGEKRVTGHLTPCAKAQQRHRAKMEDNGLSRIEIWAPANLKFRLKALAIEKETTASDFITEILKEHLRK